MIGVIGFDSQPFVVIPLQTVAQSRPYFDQMIDRLSAHGQTYLMPALQEAERTLGDSGAQVKHVVILTDGETGGTADDVLRPRLADASRRRRDDLDDRGRQRGQRRPAARRSPSTAAARFYQTDSPQNLPQLFVCRTSTATAARPRWSKRNSRRTRVSPDPMLKDLAGRQMPPLKGYVSTEIKPRATMSMFVDRGAIASR